MPLALIAIGVLLLVSAIRGTHKQLGDQLQQDFTGSGNFIYWMIALAVVGAIGYIPQFDKFSKAFLGLILLSLFLSNKGFFANFNSAITSGSASEPSNVNNISTEIPAFPSGASGSTGGFSGTAADIASTAIDLGGFI